MDEALSPSYECDGQPCTPQAFYAAACAPQRSVAVSACAGAGKTWMLVSRIARALLDGCAPEHILAITFTRRAAAEMRQRLHEWLRAWAREADDAKLACELVMRGMEAGEARAAAPRLRALYAQMLASGREVQMCTFHSWFIGLLRAAPLGVMEALGLPATYELIEDDAAAIAALWQPWLRRVAADAALRADYCALVAERGAAGTHAALVGALARRAEFVLADAAGAVAGAVPRFDEFFPHLQGVQQPREWLLVRAAGCELVRAAAQALAQGTPAVQKQGAALAAALAAGDWDGVQAALLTKEGEPRKFSDKLAGIATVREAQEEVLRLLAAERQQAGSDYHARIMRLLRSMIEEYGRLKRQRGWLDMADVELAAHRLLGSSGAISTVVLERLDMRVRHLLIDEFQDTNPLQWQALRAWLENYGGDSARPSLFIVGDAKQSIYRFRRAEPKVFEAAQHFVRTTFEGCVLACQHTRRNARAVLGAVNAAMLAAQEAGEFAGYVAHTGQSDEVGAVQALPLVPRPSRGAASGEALPPWRDSLTEPRQEAEETLLALECRQAARWVAARRAAGVLPADIMVLARKHEPLGVLQAELRRLGIASEHTEKQTLAEQPAVLDVLALVDALLSPGHDLALAQALKSPLIGWDDEKLMALAVSSFAPTDVGANNYLPLRTEGSNSNSLAPTDVGARFIAPLPGEEGQGEGAPAQRAEAGAPSTNKRLPWLHALETAPIEGAADIHARLMRWQHLLLTLPPHDALQAILAEPDASGMSGLERFTAAAPASEQPATGAHLHALLAHALAAQGGRHLSAWHWLRELRRDPPPAPAVAASGAVRLLTVHGAKGLEAAHVLLLSAHARPRNSDGDPTTLMDWPAGAPAPACLAFVAGARHLPPSLQELWREEKAAEAREEINILYVAATRAARSLTLSAAEPSDLNKSQDTWWQRLECHADKLLAPAAPVPQATGSGTDATFRLAHLPTITLPAVPEAPEDAPEKTEDSDDSRIGQAMHWLLEMAGSNGEWSAAQLVQAQRRFALDAAQLERASQTATRIRHGAGAWAWDEAHIAQAFNEVELTYDGALLRLDRLVQRKEGAWWVLDYKSAHRPEARPGLAAQLARYRAAIRALHPGCEVRAAFLSGDGRVVETEE